LNDSFENLYKNEVIKKILFSATYKYHNLLLEDEIKDCQLIGLWKCMQKYDENKGNTFKNSLYRFVIWECKNLLRSKNRKFQPLSRPKSLDGITDYEKTDKLDIKEYISFLTDDEKSVIEQKFYYRMTFKEISRENNWKYSHTKNIYNSALDNLKQICLS